MSSLNTMEMNLDINNKENWKIQNCVEIKHTQKTNGINKSLWRLENSLR